MPYYYNPHTGGTKIPSAVQERVRARILAHAAFQGTPEAALDIGSVYLDG